jgi:oxepin-CoA hydrolase/3-oxo-5,6-dehydrosuberyl-CoA semialdehyde dehydrogenase
MRLQNFALGQWVQGTGSATDLFHAVTGDKVAEASSAGLDFQAMLHYARTVGGPAMRRLTFHQRALMLKEVAKYLGERKEALYALSYRHRGHQGGLVGRHRRWDRDVLRVRQQGAS